MPKISEFYGTQIRVNSRDHLPPHFHAIHGEYKVSVDIATGEALAGVIPQRAWRMVQEWLGLHRAEVLDNWQRAQSGRPCFRIAPL